jgi:hypothetical protein
MNRYLGFCFALAFVTCLSGSLSLGQAPAPQAFPPAPQAFPPAPQALPTAPQAPAVTIKLQVVLSRYDGDKKLSSFPYTLSLVPGVTEIFEPAQRSQFRQRRCQAIKR